MSVVKNKFAIIGYNCPEDKVFKQIFFPIKVEVCSNDKEVVTVLRKRDVVSANLETLFKEVYISRICYVKEEKRMLKKGLMPRMVELISPDYGWIKFIEEGELCFRLSDSNKLATMSVKFEDSYTIREMPASVFEFVERRRKSFFDEKNMKF